MEWLEFCSSHSQIFGVDFPDFFLVRLSQIWGWIFPLFQARFSLFFKLDFPCFPTRQGLDFIDFPDEIFPIFWVGIPLVQAGFSSLVFGFSLLSWDWISPLGFGFSQVFCWILPFLGGWISPLLGQISPPFSVGFFPFFRLEFPEFSHGIFPSFPSGMFPINVFVPFPGIGGFFFGIQLFRRGRSFDGTGML